MTSSILGAIPRDALHVTTVNVRRPVGILAWRRADRWTLRRPALQTMLARERPTVLGCQEVVPAQASAISQALGPGYRRIGAGRTRSRRSEGCPMFFDSERLDLLDAWQSALSDRPTQQGSRTWGNLFPRVLVVSVFQDRVTGARFVVGNTHLDPVSASSRVRSARAIGEAIAATGLPAVVTGDINEAAGGPVAQTLRDGAGLVDAWNAAAARTTPEWSTLSRYRPPWLGPRIDVIAVSPRVRVHTAAIGTYADRDHPASDHLPVHAAISIGAAR